MRVRVSRATAETWGHCWPDTEVKVARACARRALDAASVGLPESARLASSSSVGSPKPSHHAPFGVPSLGAATRNGSSTRHLAGIGGFGRSYFGGFTQPTVHAARAPSASLASLIFAK